MPSKRTFGALRLADNVSREGLCADFLWQTGGQVDQGYWRFCDAGVIPRSDGGSEPTRPSALVSLYDPSDRTMKRATELSADTRSTATGPRRLYRTPLRSTSISTLTCARTDVSSFFFFGRPLHLYTYTSPYQTWTTSPASACVYLVPIRAAYR